MKKTFLLSHPILNLARLIESYKHEIKKYIKREQRKILPEGYDYWDFDCKYGISQADSIVVHVRELNKCLDEAEKSGLDSFYVEILAKPVRRIIKEQDNTDSSRVESSEEIE